MDMRKRKPRLGQLYLETKPTKDEVREYLGEELKTSRARNKKIVI